MEVRHNVTRRNAEIIFSIALMITAIAVYVEAGRYPEESAGYPKVLAALLGLLSLVGLVFNLLSRHKENHGEMFFLHPKRAAIGFFSLVVYMVLVGYLGFIIPSILLCVIVPRLIGYDDFKVMIPLAVGSIFAIIIIFHVILERPLPPDALDFLIKAFS